MDSNMSLWFLFVVSFVCCICLLYVSISWMIQEAKRIGKFKTKIMMRRWALHLINLIVRWAAKGEKIWLEKPYENDTYIYACSSVNAEINCKVLFDYFQWTFHNTHQNMMDEWLEMYAVYIILIVIPCILHFCFPLRYFNFCWPR